MYFSRATIALAAASLAAAAPVEKRAEINDGMLTSLSLTSVNECSKQKC